MRTHERAAILRTNWLMEWSPVFAMTRKETVMPKARTDNITMNYDQQGSGEALVLIPYLAADHACYAFQVPEYAKRFTCVSIDLRGTGQTDKPQEPYSFGIFPWCFRPELYAARPDVIDGLSDFVRSRPAQALSDFMLQSDAVLAHDVEAQLARITAPTQITFGRHDQLTSTRFADRLKGGIRHSELVIFENSAHAPIYDRVEEFNQKTLAFLQRCARGGVAAV
jgi:pimeloyl-ACP methyl ester carboxylesterase